MARNRLARDILRNANEKHEICANRRSIDNTESIARRPEVLGGGGRDGAFSAVS